MAKRQLLLFTLSLAAALVQAQPWQALGREATPAEIQAWDIDVRPDFKGLPKGAGSVALGQTVWEAQCASCHGVFGESNEVFTPLVGGTTAADIARGRVKNLELGSIFPQRTTLMKAATVSTLWDYINRAMPWNAPKSLKTEEVYGVLAYMLHLGDIVPADFTLSERNIAEVQQRLPNRQGMVFHEPLWSVKGAGDTKNSACMSNCPTEARVRSALPDFARDAHGDIAQQNRLVGPVRGADTTRPAPASLPARAAVASAVSAAAPAPAAVGPDVKALLAANACTACHGTSSKIVGPGFTQILDKHKGRADLQNYLVGKILAGGSGVFGAVPMPPQPQLKPAEAEAIARWIADGPR